MRAKYHNRHEAGVTLAKELKKLYNESVLILAVPRGGVPVALPIVEELKCDLDLTIPRKIGAPHQKEVAIGAVCEDGEVLLNPHLVQALGVHDDYINKATAQEVSEIKRRLAAYRGNRPPVDVAGRTVVLVDDGVATGFTITAALQAITRKGPKELILAVPVAPHDTVLTLSGEVNKIICPWQPEEFYAVGQFYDDFGEISDAEVQQMLNKVWQKKN